MLRHLKIAFYSLFSKIFVFPGSRYCRDNSARACVCHKSHTREFFFSSFFLFKNFPLPIVSFFIHSFSYLFHFESPPPPWKLAIALQYFRFHAVRGRSEKLLILKIGFRLLWRYLFQIYSFFSIYRYKSESFIIIITP